MKKLIIPIIGISILLTGLIGWGNKLYSETDLPYPNPTDQEGLNACIQSTKNEIALMRDARDQNLNTMLDQEKPTDEIVDEAFENMRTYRCWLDYLCEAVLYSSNAEPKDIETLKNIEKLTWEHIDSLPGCVLPENVEIPGTKLKFLEHCPIAKETGNKFNLMTANFTKCRELVNREFAELPEEDGDSSEATESFRNKSSAYIAMERALRANSAEKKNRALKNKLSSIINKMHAMEGHMELLKSHIFKLDSLLPCYPAKCD